MLRLLVVDDEPMIAKSIRRAFPDAEVVAAHSGAQALALLEGEPPFGIILCDMMMPDITGMGVHAALQQRSSQLAERIVFMTGAAFAGEVNAFLEGLPNRCLRKPFSMDEVRQLVGSLGGLVQ